MIWQFTLHYLPLGFSDLAEVRGSLSHCESTSVKYPLNRKTLFEMLHRLTYPSACAVYINTIDQQR